MPATGAKHRASISRHVLRRGRLPSPAVAVACTCRPESAGLYPPDWLLAPSCYWWQAQLQSRRVQLRNGTTRSSALSTGIDFCFRIQGPNGDQACIEGSTGRHAPCAAPQHACRLPPSHPGYRALSYLQSILSCEEPICGRPEAGEGSAEVRAGTRGSPALRWPCMPVDSAIVAPPASAGLQAPGLRWDACRTIASGLLWAWPAAGDRGRGGRGGGGRGFGGRGGYDQGPPAGAHPRVAATGAPSGSSGGGSSSTG